MTANEAQTAVMLFDLLLTAAERIADKVEQAKKEGLISPEEQQSRSDHIDAIRAKVGLPQPTAPGV